MLLSQLRITGIGGLDDLGIPLDGADGAPRRLVVLFGGEGVGKTSLLAAIATTRPGHAVAQTQRPGAPPAFAMTDWTLGDDDPTRPHPLRVMSPSARLGDERDDAVLLRRKEQALFDRRAAEGGFALTAISGARWFSRTPVLLTTPLRTILHHDARASASFDEATRADLTRETKQVLSFVSAAAALEQGAGGPGRFSKTLRALSEVMATLLEGTEIRWIGLDPGRLEPVFEAGGRSVDFDDLPRSARHKVSFGALALRALAAAYPEKDPRESEGVVLLDDLEVQQDVASQRALPGLLRKALPRVQWIVTTASPAVTLGCDEGDVLALRRVGEAGGVELHRGAEAVIH